MNDNKTQKGITLIALVITIIVMLILVAVTVSIAINGGLFGMAKEAKSQTEDAIAEENALSSGKVKVEDTWYNSMDDYLNEKPAVFSYEETEKNEDGTLKAKATYKSGKYTATIPKGFKISDKKEEQEIEKGLVIKDANENEFVWIPIIEDLNNSYSFEENYKEPSSSLGMDSVSNALRDSQEMLDYYYGTNYYNYKKDFNYEKDYIEMVNQVNRYRGFYIGRYETTIDEGSIGSKYNKPVLTADTIIKNETNPNDNNPYYYRWYGLYYVSKNANVVGNKTEVQTAMIYGQLWDKAMEFIREQKKLGNTKYDVDQITESWHSEDSFVVNSAQANEEDVALNIWDLESNGWEWTQEINIKLSKRVLRGAFSTMERFSFTS